jgi:hypothetical protein
MPDNLISIMGSDFFLGLAESRRSQCDLGSVRRTLLYPTFPIFINGFRVIHTIPEVSYTTPEVAPELWTIIASFSSRQSVARLCSVSREFSATFSAILYANIIDPPLTIAQSARLIRTLRAQTVARPHPAALIRKLGLTDGGRTNKATFKAQTKAATDSIKNLYLLIPESELRGSSLRVLHWNMAAGLNELGQIIGAPGNFPNFRELTVSSDPDTNSNFDVSVIYTRQIALNIS